ncbi:unnamed protein product [Allacma fusca]|uniref:Uncharacterized protein n=1 Tax=Allacma fusca TaxID=39272 RepID=A0A8J2PVR4_9HEXA|nr:unnamed protein product [Allacma fusca]
MTQWNERCIFVEIPPPAENREMWFMRSLGTRTTTSGRPLYTEVNPLAYRGLTRGRWGKGPENPVTSYYTGMTIMDRWNR